MGESKPRLLEKNVAFGECQQITFVKRTPLQHKVVCTRGEFFFKFIFILGPTPHSILPTESDGSYFFFFFFIRHADFGKLCGCRLGNFTS